MTNDEKIDFEQSTFLQKFSLQYHEESLRMQQVEHENQNQKINLLDEYSPEAHGSKLRVEHMNKMSPKQKIEFLDNLRATINKLKN